MLLECKFYISISKIFKVNKQHAQFSNKQTMTMISASDFLSKFFSKMWKLWTKPGSTTSRLIHVMPSISDYLRRWHFQNSVKSKTEHSIAFCGIFFRRLKVDKSPCLRWEYYRHTKALVTGRDDNLLHKYTDWLV